MWLFLRTCVYTHIYTYVLKHSLLSLGSLKNWLQSGFPYMNRAAKSDKRTHRGLYGIDTISLEAVLSKKKAWKTLYDNC